MSPALLMTGVLSFEKALPSSSTSPFRTAASAGVGGQPNGSQR
jgi:hypothetical protein